MQCFLYFLQCRNVMIDLSKVILNNVDLQTIHIMVAAPPPLPPPILEGARKISDQNNWGGPEQKIKFGGGAKFKGGPKILGEGAMNPNDVMIVGFRFIYIVYIS